MLRPEPRLDVYCCLGPASTSNNMSETLGNRASQLRALCGLTVCRVYSLKCHSGTRHVGSVTPKLEGTEKKEKERKKRKRAYRGRSVSRLKMPWAVVDRDSRGYYCLGR